MSKLLAYAASAHLPSMRLFWKRITGTRPNPQALLSIFSDNPNRAKAPSLIHTGRHVAYRVAIANVSRNSAANADDLVQLLRKECFSSTDAGYLP